MTLSPAETCRQVADIIDFESERFAMDHWEHEKGCGTTACIAGHAALLHSDGISENQRFLVSVLSQKYFAPDWRWQDRQGRRLGPEASVKISILTAMISGEHSLQQSPPPAIQRIRRSRRRRSDRSGELELEEALS